MHKAKRTTMTTLVMEELVRADDFLTQRQLQQRLNATGAQGLSRISAALRWMLQCGAVDFEVALGEVWWFATPENDRRLRRLEETADVQVKRKRKPGLKHPRSKVPRRPT